MMKLISAISLLLAAVNATPLNLVESDLGSLEKRDTEIIYLSNCLKSVSSGSPTASSEIIYYAASAQSNGQVPPTQDQCTVSASSYTTWEGQSRACKFSTGVTFTSHIEAGSHSFPSFSGTGNNGKNWNCYRDNGRGLFTTSGPEWSRTCSSVYYCVPA
ncbi:hypothetical protein J3E68DRAFT_432898 [Trichoderma sp. SZMC 28012]